MCQVDATLETKSCSDCTLHRDCLHPEHHLGAVTSLSNVHHKTRGRKRREAGRQFWKTFLFLVFISVKSAGDTAFLVQKVLVIRPEQAVHFCPHTPYLYISAQEPCVSHSSQVNLYVSLIDYVGICLLHFLPGWLTCVQHQQSGRDMLMTRGEASKLSHCKVGYAIVSVIAYYGRRKCPSFIEAKIWPQLSFLLQSLLQRKKTSVISILSSATFVFLISTVSTKVKGKSKYKPLQKSSESTVLLRYKRPSLPLR